MSYGNPGFELKSKVWSAKITLILLYSIVYVD